MKKNNLTCVLIGCIMTINPLFSQTFSEVEKPSATNNPWSIETLLRTNNNGGVNWNTPSLRARYFFNDSWSLRFQLGLGDGTGRPISEYHEYNEFIDGSGDIGTRTVKRSNLNFQLGTEYHFSGTRKLDPYASISLNFGFGNENQDAVHAVSYADPLDPSIINYGYDSNISQSTKQKYFVLGTGLNLGLDFYFVENIYLGLECGFVFSNFKYGDGEKHITIENNDPYPPEYTNITPGHKESFLGAKAELRLGWRF